MIVPIQSSFNLSWLPWRISWPSSMRKWNLSGTVSLELRSWLGAWTGGTTMCNMELTWLDWWPSPTLIWVSITVGDSFAGLTLSSALCLFFLLWLFSWHVLGLDDLKTQRCCYPPSLGTCRSMMTRLEILGSLMRFLGTLGYNDNEGITTSNLLGLKLLLSYLWFWFCWFVQWTFIDNTHQCQGGLSIPSRWLHPSGEVPCELSEFVPTATGCPSSEVCRTTDQELGIPSEKPLVWQSQERVTWIQCSY